MPPKVLWELFFCGGEISNLPHKVVFELIEKKRYNGKVGSLFLKRTKAQDPVCLGRGCTKNGQFSLLRLPKMTIHFSGLYMRYYHTSFSQFIQSFRGLENEGWPRFEGAKCYAMFLRSISFVAYCVPQAKGLLERTKFDPKFNFKWIFYSFLLLFLKGFLLEGAKECSRFKLNVLFHQFLSQQRKNYLKEWKITQDSNVKLLMLCANNRWWLYLFLCILMYSPAWETLRENWIRSSKIFKMFICFTSQIEHETVLWVCCKNCVNVFMKFVFGLSLFVWGLFMLEYLCVVMFASKWWKSIGGFCEVFQLKRNTKFNCKNSRHITTKFNVNRKRVQYPRIIFNINVLHNLKNFT